jgi:hypothetical protein
LSTTKVLRDGYRSAMRRTLQALPIFLLTLAAACASTSEKAPATTADDAQAQHEADEACVRAQAAARAAWLRHFGGVTEMSPSDREIEVASAAGDEQQVDAVQKTRQAQAICAGE